MWIGFLPLLALPLAGSSQAKVLGRGNDYLVLVKGGLLYLRTRDSNRPFSEKEKSLLSVVCTPGEVLFLLKSRKLVSYCTSTLLPCWSWPNTDSVAAQGSEVFVWCSPSMLLCFLRGRLLWSWTSDLPLPRAAPRISFCKDRVVLSWPQFFLFIDRGSLVSRVGGRFVGCYSDRTLFLKERDLYCMNKEESFLVLRKAKKPSVVKSQLWISLGGEVKKIPIADLRPGLALERQE